MNSQSIRIFLALTEYKSISDAAEALYFSQSAVSQSLNQLEKELGVQLFLRGRGARQIQLTPAGEAFLPLAQTRMDADSQIQQFIRMQKQKYIRIAANPTAHLYLIPDIIQDLMQCYTGPELELDLQLRARTNAAIPAHAESNLCDIAFYSGEPPVSKFFTTIPFFQSEICLLCSAETILPDRPISPAELDPRFEITHSTFSRQKIHADWHHRNFPEEVASQMQTSTFISLGNYLTDPRRWTAIPMIQANYFVSANPSKLTIRHMDPVPYYRTCSILVSNSYLHTGVIDNVLACCRKFLAARPYLIDCLPK